MASSTQHQPLAIDTCVHIYTISAAMIGVCLTGVGLIRLVISLKTSDTLADDLLCLDAVIFLFATISADWALRVRRLERLEFIANVAFAAGLGLMAGICGSSPMRFQSESAIAAEPRACPNIKSPSTMKLAAKRTKRNFDRRA